MPQPLPLWDAFAICEGPSKDDRTCCGLTKRGTLCKLYVTEDVHKAGIEKLNSLARQPFDLPVLQDRLHDIVPHFLCARWHRQLQVNQVRERWEAAAIRNQGQAHTTRRGSGFGAPPRGERALSSETRLHAEPTRPRTSVSASRSGLDHPRSTPTTERQSPSQVSARRLTEAVLRDNRVPWEVTEAVPAVLSIAKESGGKSPFTCEVLRKRLACETRPVRFVVGKTRRSPWS
ncbi:hypothetical protein N7476_000355 [Penicillium atrosanguineum]|uniref:Uncharacterized protein n=1 Tax=Penicillium atrosanguineum TaxID=1132637 RepID=A0A9W9UBK3_9EURO|nr:hypothetical protein N7476_000355 [Penicillium atrosanguineum]